MTLLNLAFNDIPRQAILTTASTETSDHPHENLFHGPSGVYWESDGDVMESLITLDLGASLTAQAEYIAFRGIRSMILSKGATTISLELHGSTDNFGASDDTLFSFFNVELTDLIGTHDEDLIITGAASGFYRYFRIEVISILPVQHLIQKCYFGMFFNFDGRSPRYSFTNNVNTGNNRGFIADAGTMFSTSSGRARRELALTWHGIPDDTFDFYRQNIEQFTADYPIFLYAPDTFDHYVLENLLAFGWLTSNDTSGDQWRDTNIISTTFTEDIIG